MKFAIIIPVKEINDYIVESLPHIFKLNKASYEIIILPNDHFASPYFKKVLKKNNLLDPKLKCLELKSTQLKNITIIPTGKVTPAVKRDIGANHTDAEVLAFLDDDAYPDENWLVTATEAFKNKNVHAIGGPGVTPENDSLGQQVSGLVYESYVCGGPYRYRYRPIGEEKEVDDFPSVNFLVRKKQFIETGGFGTEFWPGEDTKFCREFNLKGFNIKYIPELLVWHHRRNIFAGHLKQMGGYGLHRGYFAKKFPENSKKIAYFLPSAFFIFIIGGWAAKYANPVLLKLYFAIIAFYLVICAVDALRLTRNPLKVFLTVITIFSSHIVYGMRFLWGFLIPKLKSRLR